MGNQQRNSRQDCRPERTKIGRRPYQPPVDIEPSLGQRVRHLSRAFMVAISKELSRYGVKAGQWSALRVLWKEEGLSQVELAERMRIERASLTSIVATLEKDKLIRRVPDSIDRRRIRIFLTTKGRNLEDELLSLGKSTNERATRGLTASQIAQFHLLLDRMMSNLK